MSPILFYPYKIVNVPVPATSQVYVSATVIAPHKNWFLVVTSVVVILLSILFQFEKKVLIVVNSPTVTVDQAISPLKNVEELAVPDVDNLAAVTEASEGSVIKPTPLCTMKSFVEVDAITESKVMVAAEMV